MRNSGPCSHFFRGIALVITPGTLAREVRQLRERARQDHRAHTQQNSFLHIRRPSQHCIW